MSDKCDLCHLPLEDRDGIDVMNYHLHIDCVAYLGTSLSGVKGAMQSSILSLLIRGMRAGDHLAFVYRNKIELEDTVTEFIRRSTDKGELNLLLVTEEEATEYIAYLREQGIKASAMLNAGEIAVEPVDGLLDKDPDFIVGRLSGIVERMLRTARWKNKRGLNVIGRLAGNLAKQGKYLECIKVETYWHERLLNAATTRLPITLLCPYENISTKLEAPLRKTHTRTISA